MKLTKDLNESQYSFKIRKLYTNYILNNYNIDNNLAIVLGYIKSNKINYKLSYLDDFDNLIDEIDKNILSK